MTKEEKRTEPGANSGADLGVAERVALFAGWLLDKKARELVAINFSEREAFTEAVIIVSATSVRHAQGLVDHVMHMTKGANLEFLHLEGYHVGQWILLDMNDIVISIFQDDARLLYNLEGLWNDVPRFAMEKAAETLAEQEDS